MTQQYPISQLTVQQGDLLDVCKGAIVHQVNLQGVMGAGLADQIRGKYPKVFTEYKLAIQQKQLRLGDAQFVQVGEQLWVCNAVGQNNYGRQKGKCYTDYLALANAFSQVNAWQKRTGLPVYLPYRIGAGLAGGDWSTIERLITDNLPDAIIVTL